MKQLLCKKCGSTDSSKFRGSSKSLCWECSKARYREYYKEKWSHNDCCLCSECGEDDWNKFYPNSKSICKECVLNKAKEHAVKNPPQTKECLCSTCNITDKQKFNHASASICRRCLAKEKFATGFFSYDELVAAQGGEFCYVCKRAIEECTVTLLSGDFDKVTGEATSPILNLYLDKITGRGTLVCSNCKWGLDHLKQFEALEKK